jgi:hypothetical protein
MFSLPQVSSIPVPLLALLPRKFNFLAMPNTKTSKYWTGLQVAKLAKCYG